MKLLETWVKFPRLIGRDIVIMSECLESVAPKVFQELSKDKIVFTVCPEAEPGGIIYGKLASMMTSTKPASITVVTIDGSPHCFNLQAAVNEAYYITGARIPKKHLVWFDDELHEISADCIRIARYLSLVQKLIQDSPQILEELAKFSLEYKASLRIKELLK